MSESYNRVIDILKSDKTSLRELAELAGADPADFYRGCDLSGADLRGQDLRGISFEGAVLREIVVDNNTQFSHETKLRVPMAINFLKVAHDGLHTIRDAVFVADSMDWLATSAGQPRARHTAPIKESSPVDVFVDQVRARLYRCASEFEHADPANRIIRHAEGYESFLKHKLLLDLWEVVAFANYLTGDGVTFPSDATDAYYVWREHVFQQPMRKKLGPIEFNEGWIEIEGSEPAFLHLEVMLVAVFLLDCEFITLEQLDRAIRGYYHLLRDLFPGEVAQSNLKVVSF